MSFHDLAESINEDALEKVTQLINLPRGWGSIYQDGPKKGVWYRRKRNGYHDLLRPEAFKSLIKKWPINISVSNHDGNNFNNFQSFVLFDFDCKERPDLTKEPLVDIAEILDTVSITYLPSDSAGKGYHLFIYPTAPIHTKEVEQFQHIILTKAQQKKPKQYVHVSTDTWAYFSTDKPYDPNKKIKDQECVMIEFLTSIGDGKMIRPPLSKHPRLDRVSMPMTIAQIQKHDRSSDQTTDDVKRACNLIRRLKRTPYEKVIDIAEISDPKKPGKIKIRDPKIYKRIRFKIPDPSDELDRKCDDIFEHIVNTPCLQTCYESAVSINGVYHLRANIVTVLANMKYTREEIAYFFYHHINDDADNANRGMLEYQVDYWYRRKYHCRCEYWQEVDSSKFSCDEPCGRRHPAQAEPEPDHIHLTRVKEFTEIYDKCREILKRPERKILCPKTTRAGFTTALNIVAREEGKRILYLVPRTSISELTFADTICLAKEKKGIIINGMVISANSKSCLVRLKEATEFEEAHGRPLNVSIPIPRDDCKTCAYNGTIVHPNENQPLISSDVDNDACAQSTYRTLRETFDSGFTTYAKLNAILNTPSQSSFDLLDDIKNYDILVLDEISQFMENASLEIPLHAKHRHDNLTYNFVAVLNKQMNTFLQWVETGETIENLHKYITLFINHFEDYSEFNDGDKVPSPLEEDEQARLHSDMIIYLNQLYNYALVSGNDVGAIYHCLSILCEPHWYISKTQSMEYQISINFVVPPKNQEVLNWILEEFTGKIVITDATLPYQNLQEVFGEDLLEFPIMDPMGTADTQLVICDSTTITPTRVFNESGIERLKGFTNAITDYHKDGFMVATSNTRTRSEFIQTFPDIPPENCTYQRSNRTIGVSCNLRVSLCISHPYAPKNAFNWMSMNMKGDLSIAQKLLKVNARNSYFQTIGRVKDPLAQTLSVVYAYGVKKAEIDNLLKTCVGIPHVIEMPVIKDVDNAHTIVADYWLTTGRHNISPNQIKVLVLHRIGLTKKAIREKTRLDSKFVARTMKDLDLE